MQSKAAVAEKASGKLKFSALTLDFWGTLVDWLPVWESVSEVIVKKNNLKCSSKEFALAWRRAGRWYVEKMPRLRYREMVKRSLDEVCKTFGISPAGEEQLLFGRWNEIAPFSEVASVLSELKKRHELVIVSNADPELFAMAVKKIPVVFDGILISDETGVPKPHFEMYEKAIKFLAVPKSQILHVASSQMDVCGAANAGLPVCWINRRREQRSPETPKPQYEISDLKELLKIVE
jgi:2-haloacid dehalogenase